MSPYSNSAVPAIEKAEEFLKKKIQEEQFDYEEYFALELGIGMRDHWYIMAQSKNI